jgi:hypothetical protein
MSPSLLDRIHVDGIQNFQINLRALLSGGSRSQLPSRRTGSNNWTGYRYGAIMYGQDIPWTENKESLKFWIKSIISFMMSSIGWHVRTLDGIGMELAIITEISVILLDRMEPLGDRIQELSKILEYLSEI